MAAAGTAAGGWRSIQATATARTRQAQSRLWLREGMTGERRRNKRALAGTRRAITAAGLDIYRMEPELPKTLIVSAGPAASMVLTPNARNGWVPLRWWVIFADFTGFLGLLDVPVCHDVMIRTGGLLNRFQPVQGRLDHGLIGSAGVQCIGSEISPFYPHFILGLCAVLSNEYPLIVYCRLPASSSIALP
jgi:hypothetical protein